jgi:hypothetical protein
MPIHGDEWFWGGQFTEEQKREFALTFDRILNGDGFMALMKYDRQAGVATLHVILGDGMRGGLNVGRLIARAVEMAVADGMQKVVAPLVGGSPFLKPNRDRKFGFTREAVLRRHVFIGGALRDLHLYTMFL